MNFKDLTGQRFGRWTAIRRGPNLGRHVQWICRCDCGNERLVSSTNLVSGSSGSCGCLHRDAITTHNETNSPEHRAWNAMKARCYTTSNIGYPHYGGRGIAVCEHWRNSFPNFLEDMGRKPSPNHSLDRIDPNGNYSPNNCQWATRDEQLNNTRRTRLITFHGKTQTVAQWAQQVGLRKSCLLYRLNAGWSVERALMQPSSRSQR